MWSDSSIVNKLLKRLLRCLLCVHLRPDEDESQRAWLVAERKAGRDEPSEKIPKTGVPVNDICFARKIRNGRRKIITSEAKKQQKYLRKGKWVKKEHVASRKKMPLTMWKRHWPKMRYSQKGHKISPSEELDSYFSKSDKVCSNRRPCQSLVLSCYHSSSQCQFELRKNRYLDRIASYERKSSSVRHPIMFVGGRGHGYGFSIKGHLRGHWKEERHGRYTPTVTTDEYNSSQTCLFCFGKLSHPTYAKDDAVKIIRGIFLCMNTRCPNNFRFLCRDQVSALAIGLTGVAQHC
ncbi:hypothetical protein MAM1_0156d06793 [Mucor ambiguus]|uniref:Uncharacterized protein n=1 Tax=Mucor ambiguus TaxID=91626 RepID=A0A0C9MV36_9FUNG|nr:hypothetical protein MAM1_0156d06793 [Mucor ambiguus]